MHTNVNSKDVQHWLIPSRSDTPTSSPQLVPPELLPEVRPQLLPHFLRVPNPLRLFLKQVQLFLQRILPLPPAARALAGRAGPLSVAFPARLDWGAFPRPVINRSTSAIVSYTLLTPVELATAPLPEGPRDRVGGAALLAALLLRRR